MKLLAEEIGLKSKEDIRSFDFAEVETLSGYIFRSSHHRVGVWTDEVSKLLSGGHNVFENILFLWLKRQTRNDALPVLEVFKFRACSIARNLDSIVTNRTFVLVVFFNLPTGYFETLAMIPM